MTLSAAADAARGSTLSGGEGQGDWGVNFPEQP